MSESVDPSMWEDRNLRTALAKHDIGTVFLTLHNAGISYRTIGAITGLRQSEVSEIVHGRQVTAYDLLERISDGLAIPRGWMGLAYTTRRDEYPGYSEDAPNAEEGDDMVSRRVLGAITAALLGEAALDRPIMQLGTNILGEPCGLPKLIGSSESLGILTRKDVPWIRAMADKLWSLDLEHGGATYYQAAYGVTTQVIGALKNSRTDLELLLASSNLCRVAAWAAYDSGQTQLFWQLHATALDLAKEAGDTTAIVRLVHNAGRAEILSGNHKSAAKLFELATVRSKPSAVDWGLLGSAYAPLDTFQAKRAIRHLKDAEGADTLDAAAMYGHVSSDLGDYQTALSAFNKVVPHRTGRLVLQETVPLAIACLNTGERAIGLAHAAKVVELASEIRSVQCTNAIIPLSNMLADQKDSTSQDLSRRLIKPSL